MGVRTMSRIRASGTTRDFTGADQRSVYRGYTAPIDAFTLITIGTMAALIIAIFLLGAYHPRSGNDVLDWKPTRSPELEVQNEIDDVEQMLEAANQRRRARGESELTEADLRERVSEDLREANQRREAYLDDADLKQMLAATNERRRGRGEAELTDAEYRARVEADQSRLGRLATD